MFPRNAGIHASDNLGPLSDSREWLEEVIVEPESVTARAC